MDSSEMHGCNPMPSWAVWVLCGPTWRALLLFGFPLYFGTLLLAALIANLTGHSPPDWQGWWWQ